MVKVSPIFYMGCKRKLIKKGLCDFFPDNINGFVDVFSGSCIVSLNTKAKSYWINDIDDFLNKLYSMFLSHSSEQIISYVDSFIERFNLPRERTKRNEFRDKDKIEEYKKCYIKARNFANETKDIKALYALSFFSFSQQFRFNNKGVFNMPFGNDCFTEQNKENIRVFCDFLRDNEIYINKNDYKDILNEEWTKDDFIYLDPPYSITTAVYNESSRPNGGWSAKDDEEMCLLLDDLTDKGVKWGMSNALSAKGKNNDFLKEWAKKYNVHNFNGFSYSSCGKGNSNTEEVYIYNHTR